MAAINYDFIEQLEGFATEAYVPEDKFGNPLGKSGGTIGTGVDLAHQSEEGLRLAGVEETTIAALRPLLGVRGKTAQKLLRNNPIQLKDAQLRSFDRAIMDRDLGRLAKQFNKVSAQKFENLPLAMQTVLFSVGHQYGNMAKKTPNFWDQVTSGQFNTALGNLRNFGDKYPTRRGKEADLFERGIIEEFLGVYDE